MNDCVILKKGVYKGKRATIKCLYGKFAFLYNKDFNQTNGIFLEYTNNLEIMGSELLEEDKNQRVKINMFSVPDNLKKLLGKTVKIIKGSYKGYSGILKSADQNKAKVELLSRNKTVTLDVDDILDYNSTQISNISDVSATPRAYGNGNKTPGYYPQSPNMFSGGISPKWTWNPQTPK